MCGGGEGGIREVEKDYGGGHSFIHSFYETGRREFYERGSLEDWRVKFYSGIYSAPGGG
jgi:hypothetical protein